MKKETYEVLAENYRKAGLSVPEKMGFEAMAEDYLARGVVIMELNDKLDNERKRLLLSGIALAAETVLVILLIILLVI